MAVTLIPEAPDRPRRRLRSRPVRAVPSRSAVETGTAGDADITIGTRSAGRGRRLGWGQRYASRLAAMDVLAVLCGAIAVHTVTFGSLTTRVAGEPTYLPFLAMTIVLSLVWLLALDWGRTRDPKVVGNGPDEYRLVIHTTLAVFGIAAILSFVLALELPRSYLLVMMPAGLAALLLGRFGARRWLHRRRGRGEYMSTVLLVGNLRTVRELLADLRRDPLHGYRVVGACVKQGSMPGDLSFEDSGEFSTLDGVPILGGLDDVAAVAARCGADTVAVTSSASFGPSAVRRLSWELESTNTDLVLAPALTNIAGPRIHTQPVAGLPLIHVDRPTYRGANRVLKRSFDIVGSATLLLLLSPVFLAVAIAVKATSPGKVFFRQERVGLNGTAFRMIKFRSMVANAEDLLAEIQRDRDAGNEVLLKVKNDPRITKVGRFMRRFSVDELPQLINVLLGDMSLVGPRPPLAAEVELYEDDAKRRLLVKPGMTGLWQVSGRSDLNWEETVRLDVYYVENWSLTSDLVILWKTAKAVVSSSGAY